MPTYDPSDIDIHEQIAPVLGCIYFSLRSLGINLKSRGVFVYIYSFYFFNLVFFFYTENSKHNLNILSLEDLPIHALL